MLAPSIRFEPQSLPTGLGILNRLTERLSIDAPLLTPERLTASAARYAGLPDKFPPHVQQSLEVLCRSLHDEAGLHWFGRMNYSMLLVTGMASLLQVEQAFRDDPSLAKTELVPPVIVTGLPRSGTTYLHRLLCASEDAAAVALYQHVYPVVRRPIDHRRAEFSLRFAAWRMASRAYAMDAMHLMRSELPDECNWGMRLGGRSMIFWNAAPACGYLHWLLDQDMRETYQLYRKVLLLHQRAMPGRRLTLKCPHHMAWLPALTEALPEARVVQVHRDPLQTVASDCKLSLSMHCMSTNTADLRKSVEHVLIKNQCYAERAVAFAATPDGNKVHHLEYQRLVNDPVGLARDLHSSLRLPFTDGHESALRTFAASNKQYKHGRNPYSLEQFALEPVKLRKIFRTYRERFLSEPDEAVPDSDSPPGR